ncbi:MAG: FAD binding domain-containing protein [Pyrinomonadaceae bacterium]|nr:FAD binding domain-containing protein [Pyrinomonadaceae bacterium]
MIRFILNNQTIETELPKGFTVLDFVRYRKNLKGTKIGCREGDCGACTVLVGELIDKKVKYRTQTSCLMPLANAAGKHIVTIEGINKENGELTEVQQALVDESGTQCGFCTVGFVMSLTNFCLDETPKTNEMAVSAIDGNICRCTGYKSIERAAMKLCDKSEPSAVADGLSCAIEKEIVPEYFKDINFRLKVMSEPAALNRSLQQTVPTRFVSGGTDLYVQRPEVMVHAEAESLFDNTELRFIKESDDFVELGASVVVTDLLESEVFNRLFPNLYKHLKLVSSTPIRNMATLAGNFVNASPIGDMTAWFLALNAQIELSKPPASADGRTAQTRNIALKDFYLGYKQLAKSDDEFISKIRFRKNFTNFNFEKVCKRTYLDIASVNTAISLRSEPPASAGGSSVITKAHVSAGGVAPIPLYLRKTSEFLRGREISQETIAEAHEIIQTEIAPISDVRGAENYKRLLLRQLFTAHFVELFNIKP